MSLDQRQHPPSDGMTGQGQGHLGEVEGRGPDPAGDPLAGKRDALATLEDVADFLQVPPKTLYQWRYRGEGPPGFLVGRHLRFRWEDVEQWLAGEIRRTSKHAARLGGGRGR
jgi:excisionase family DNA binding protein